MKTVGRRLMKAAVCAVLALTLFVHGGAEASAITTKFMVPTISNSFTPDNCIYKSPNLNIMVCKWGYGWVVDILNTNRDLGSLLAEALEIRLATFAENGNRLAVIQAHHAHEAFGVELPLPMPHHHPKGLHGGQSDKGLYIPEGTDMNGKLVHRNAPHSVQK